MRISQKRTCNGCIGITHRRCELGYDIEPVYYDHTIVGGKPKEPCPKPKTYKDYSYAFDNCKKWQTI